MLSTDTVSSKENERRTNHQCCDDRIRCKHGICACVIEVIGIQTNRIQGRSGDINQGTAAGTQELVAGRLEMKLKISLGGEWARSERSAACDWVDQSPEGCMGSKHQTSNPTMVIHAATVINRFSVDQDQRTPMEKTRGTTANHEMAEFGEKILFSNP